jgi:hypothetical protein
VGIICPGSQRLVSKGADKIPDKAAAIYDGKKTKTYSDQANFVPFIVNTGGRNAAGLHFLSRILPLEAMGAAGFMRRQGRAALAASHVHWRFNRATCLHRLPKICAPDRAAQGDNGDYQELGLEVDDDDPTDG